MTTSRHDNTARRSCRWRASRHDLWLLTVTAVLACAAPAAAQSGPQPLIRVGVGGGLSVPVADAGDALRHGLNGQAFVLVNAGGIPLRFNLGYQKFDLREALASGASGDGRILSGLAGVNVDLVQVGPAVPYVTAGLGAFNLNSALNADGVGTSGSATKLGVDAGAGLRMRLGRLDAFVEGRLQNIWTNDGAASSGIRTIPVSFGLLF
jgi:opacity protein-like surface antigen